MTTLDDIARCLQGIVPSSLSTCALDGTPNVTFLSQVHYVDAKRVALTRQFFNKSSQNLAANPRACVLVFDPPTMKGYRLHLRFERSVTSGPVFDAMATRLAAIASQTRMTGIFRLLAADIFEVLEVEKLEGDLEDPPASSSEPPPEQAMSLDELRAVHAITSMLSRVADLSSLVDALLPEVARMTGMSHTSLMLTDEGAERLFTIASHGYERSGIGSEVLMGEGLVGTAAKERRSVRVSDLQREFRYARAMAGRDASPIATPGLSGVESILVVPLVQGEEVLGAIVAESAQRGAFSDRQEALLGIIANQAAARIHDLRSRSDAEDAPPARRPSPRPPPHLRRRVAFEPGSESLFVDGAYLIRSVPAKILWKVLREHQATGRVDFTNRELRADAALALPAVKDNLETRLILLRRRLSERCADIRLVPSGRGRFRLELDAVIELAEQ